MAKYRVLEKTYINNSIAEVGEIVEYDGQAGRTLELIGKEAPVKAEEPANTEAPAAEAKPQKGFARKAAKSADAN